MIQTMLPNGCPAFILEKEDYEIYDSDTTRLNEKSQILFVGGSTILTTYHGRLEVLKHNDFSSGVSCQELLDFCSEVLYKTKEPTSRFELMDV